MARRRLRFKRRFIRRRGYRRGYRKTFTKRVKATIMRTAELKNVTTTVNTMLNTILNTVKLVPSIAQGAGDNQRIGNKVMSRNFQIKLQFTLTPVQGAISEEIRQMRLIIVWPRTMSDTDAVAQINTSNFPINNIVDQDNWIIWMDKTVNWTAYPLLYPAYRQTYRLEFNKRFFCTLEWKNSGTGTSTKTPYLIIVSDHNAGYENMTVRGYAKLSYKDV